MGGADLRPPRELPARGGPTALGRLLSAGGSAVRAWLVAHQALPVGVAFGCVAAGGASYALVRVPGAHGGPIPLWWLVPPTLAMFAALAAVDQMPRVGPTVRSQRPARTAWAATVVLAAAGSAAVVGEAAGQSDLPLLTAALAALATAAGPRLRWAAVAVGAVPLVAVLGSPAYFGATSPGLLLDQLAPAGRIVALVVVALGVAAHGRIEPRDA